MASPSAVPAALFLSVPFPEIAVDTAPPRVGNDGSASGGKAGCTLQIQAMTWRPGSTRAPCWFGDDPRRENGPKAAALPASAVTPAGSAGLILRFLTAINAVGTTANPPVFSWPPAVQSPAALPGTYQPA